MNVHFLTFGHLSTRSSPAGNYSKRFSGLECYYLVKFSRDLENRGFGHKFPFEYWEAIFRIRVVAFVLRLLTGFFCCEIIMLIPSSTLSGWFIFAEFAARSVLDFRIRLA